MAEPGWRAAIRRLELLEKNEIEYQHRLAGSEKLLDERDAEIRELRSQLDESERDRERMRTQLQEARRKTAGGGKRK